MSLAAISLFVDSSRPFKLFKKKKGFTAKRASESAESKANMSFSAHQYVRFLDDKISILKNDNNCLSSIHINNRLCEV